MLNKIFEVELKKYKMKNNLKYLSLLSLIVLGFTSCDDEDDGYQDKIVDTEGYAYLADQTISSFDKNEPLTIDLYNAEGVTFNSVEVMQDGEVISTAEISGETATFNSGVLGDIEIDNEFDVVIESQLSNGLTPRDPFTIGVVSPISIDGDNPAELSLEEISEGASLVYSTYTLSAPIDSAELSLKKNSAGSYADSGADVSTEGGEIDLTSTNYESLDLAVNDTLYYQFEVNSGELSETDSSYIVIKEAEETEE